MGQTGAAHQNPESGILIGLQIIQHVRSRNRQLDTVVDKHQPPQIRSHFLQGAQKTEHQFQTQFIIPKPHPVRGTHDHDFAGAGFRHGRYTGMFHRL